MFLIAGLGNPERKYDGSRHNVGFAVMDELEARFRIPIQGREHKGLTGKGIIGGEKVILVKPQTYMNASGDCVGELASYYKIPPEQVLVIYDDINLDVGQLRIRMKGSAGGHNGMKSIIARLGSENFPRIRVGVGAKPAQMDLVDHVLGHFQGQDKIWIQDGVMDAAAAVELLLSQGIAAAMNRFNQARQPERE